MYAVIDRVKIKPGHEQESLAMIEKDGIALVSGFSRVPRRLLGTNCRW
jgi:hypothetical protein